MTSSTWTSEAPAPLLACGVDVEDWRRFADIVRQPGRPMPFVFTARELDLARSLSSPETQLCAAFCCKEALVKALRGPFDFDHCELAWPASVGEGELEVDAGLAAERGFGVVRAVISDNPDSGSELIAAVYLFQK
jgi:hypothetical protein